MVFVLPGKNCECSRLLWNGDNLRMRSVPNRAHSGKVVILALFTQSGHKLKTAARVRWLKHQSDDESIGIEMPIL